VAALTVGRSDDLGHARRLITEGPAADRGELADRDTDLASLGSGQPTAET
jgi:hypothetical protein